MFVQTFTAQPCDIDELGHVNNAVWLVWAQQLATAHWQARARPEDLETYFWVITRHEVDYHGNIGLGETVEGRTQVVGQPQGARFARRATFHRLGEAKPIVSVLTDWAMLHRAQQRLVRITADVVAPFLAERAAFEAVAMDAPHQSGQDPMEKPGLNPDQEG